MSRQTWVIGNWKQNLLRDAAAECARGISASAEGSGDVHIGLAPGYMAIDAVRSACNGGPVAVFAQDVAAQESGAFTGEVGPAMLREAGVTGAIVGHSERRSQFGDDDARVHAKLRSALDGGLTVVLCVGESLDVREAGNHEKHVISQLSSAFSDVDLQLATEQLLIAYEPIWAIGTGRTATPDQADAMHGCIRRWLASERGSAAADRSVLYGGSVKPTNANELIACPEIDGFLVGGASLDAVSFLAIVAAAKAARPS